MRIYIHIFCIQNFKVTGTLHARRRERTRYVGGICRGNLHDRPLIDNDQEDSRDTTRRIILRAVWHRGAISGNQALAGRERCTDDTKGSRSPSLDDLAINLLLLVL